MIKTPNMKTEPKFCKTQYKLLTKVVYVFIITGCILSIDKSYAQTITFQKTIQESDSQYLTSVIQTPDNGYIAVGTARILPVEYIYIVRFNSLGDTLWTRKISGGNATDVIKTNDNHYALCDILGRIVKFDVNGNILFISSFYSLDTGIKKIVQNINGDYFLCGSYFPSVRIYPFLIKLNENGVYLWDSVYTQGFYDGSFRAMLIAEDNIVLTGSYSLPNTLSNNIFLMKVDFNGQRLFFNSGVEEGFYPYDIIITSSGSFIICGRFRHGNPFIAKYNNQGLFQWISTYDTTTVETANSITLDHEGNYVYTGSFDESDYVRIRKTDTNGVTIWKKQHSINNQYQFGSDIQQTSDSGFVIMGCNR